MGIRWVSSLTSQVPRESVELVHALRNWNPYMHVEIGPDAPRPDRAAGDPYIHVGTGTHVPRPEWAGGDT